MHQHAPTHDRTTGAASAVPDLVSLADPANSSIARNLPKEGKFWRSIGELEGTPEFEESLRREFPQQATELVDPESRRNFLKLMGASIALAGINGCMEPPPEKIVPYVDAPEGIIPGRPLHYATAMPLDGYGLGLLATSQMGRPTKLEGNELHPASLGATDVFAQASILDLYDPDRLQAITYNDQINSWSAFLEKLRPRFEAFKANGGAGLRILSGGFTSPTLAKQADALLEAFPQARWVRYEPLGSEAGREGALRAFGQAVDTVYHFDRANVVVSFDVDFTCDLNASVRYARDYMRRRRAYSGPDTETPVAPSRLYALASAPSLVTGGADHRLVLRSAQIESAARQLAVNLQVPGIQGPAEELDTFSREWLRLLAEDLAKPENRGASLLVTGSEQTAAVHALLHAINAHLGNVSAPGSDTGTVAYTAPVEYGYDSNGQDRLSTLGELVDDIRADRVEVLLILDVNLVYNAPVEYKLGELLLSKKNSLLRVYLGQYKDETARVSQWVIPAAHYLESWSDVRAFDGTESIIQPLIKPLFNGKTKHDLLLALAGPVDVTGYQLVQQTTENNWKARGGSGDFSDFWETSLHDGVIANSAVEQIAPSLNLQDTVTPLTALADGEYEVLFRPDPAVRAGEYSNNGWLQELPKPLSKVTWDNVAHLSVNTARELGLSNGDTVQLSYRGQEVTAPIWILPGQNDKSIAVYLGYGRQMIGRQANGIGYNAYQLRHADAPWFDSGLKLTKTGQKFPLANTQDHWSLEGRNIVRFGTYADYETNPWFVQGMHDMHESPTLYPPVKYEGYAWGMAIDQTSCLGCSACVIACQAENNIPIVGKSEVMRNREMHWLRIDRYYYSSVEEGMGYNRLMTSNPETLFQPMLCQHCENASCELVCPVAATVHDSEGLNSMIYNRCVGTRYCANNCPYKVRRFNFFQYQDLKPSSLNLANNPEVTIRNRGVMEKCSFCTQRISMARIEAKKRGDKIKDGEVRTACQAACPTEAIVFGDLNDPESQVHKLREKPLSYAVLDADLNTKPRVSYQGRLYNPNPELLALEEKEYGRKFPEPGIHRPHHDDHH